MGDGLSLQSIKVILPTSGVNRRSASQHHSPVGQERSRTIALPDIETHTKLLSCIARSCSTDSHDTEATDVSCGSTGRNAHIERMWSRCSSDSRTVIASTQKFAVGAMTDRIAPQQKFALFRGLMLAKLLAAHKAWQDVNQSYARVQQAEAWRSNTLDVCSGSIAFLALAVHSRFAPIPDYWPTGASESACRAG
jgi:hypothetical protein